MYFHSLGKKLSLNGLPNEIEFIVLYSNKDLPIYDQIKIYDKEMRIYSYLSTYEYITYIHGLTGKIKNRISFSQKEWLCYMAGYERYLENQNA